MESNLGKSVWTLTTEHPASSYGIPVLVNRCTQLAYGSSDIVSLYPSWGLTTASLAVMRLGKIIRKSKQTTNLINKFCGTGGSDA